jgi:hypothetical protein
MRQVSLILCYFLIICLALPAQKKIKKGVPSFTSKADTLYVSKVKCISEYLGFKLVIVESKNFPRNTACSDFSYNLLWQAEVNMKIRLIEELLTFESDTSLSCCKIYSYSTNTKKNLSSIKSKRYTMQLSALYHINLICFGQFAPFGYSPFPVLFDTESNCEINDNQEKILEVFQIYKKWFYTNKLDNFKSYTFPLNMTKYKWVYGTAKMDKFYHGLPVISSDYKLKVGIRK